MEDINSEPARMDQRFQWLRSTCQGAESILDVGCGDQAAFPGWMNVTSLDVDLWHTPNFVRGDAHHLPFHSHSFQVVVASEVLEHVQNPVLMLKEARRVSRRRVVVTVPCEERWDETKKPYTTQQQEQWREGLTYREQWKKKTVNHNRCTAAIDDRNYPHLWHRRHYTEKLLREHGIWAGFHKLTINLLEYQGWAFYCAVFQ